jgi:hypothetical protein
MFFRVATFDARSIASRASSHRTSTRSHAIARASAEGIHGGHRRAISLSSSRDADDASDDLRAREHPETVR